MAEMSSSSKAANIAASTIISLTIPHCEQARRRLLRSPQLNLTRAPFPPRHRFWASAKFGPSFHCFHRPRIGSRPGKEAPEWRQVFAGLKRMNHFSQVLGHCDQTKPKTLSTQRSSSGMLRIKIVSLLRGPWRRHKTSLTNTYGSVFHSVYCELMT